MNSLIKTLILILVFLCTALFGTQKQTDGIAKISAVSLYNIDKNSLQKTIKEYIKTHPDLKALKVIESLSGEIYIEFFIKDGEVIYETIPSNHLDTYTQFKAKSIYENEEVGLVFAYFSQNSSTSLNSQEIQWLRENPTITIAVVDNYPPYDYRNDNNSLEGFHSDIVNKMNENLGSNIVLKAFESWEKAYSMVKDGKVNAIFSLSWSKEREDKYFDYTSPYHFVPHYLIVKKNNNTIYSLESLSNKKIAIQVDTIFEKIVDDQVPNAQVVYVKNTKESYESVQNETSEATISPNLDELPLDKYDLKVVSEIYHKSSNVHIGVNKKYPIISSILDKGIKSISLQELGSLRDKWFKEKSLTLKLTKKEKEWLDKNPVVKLAYMKHWTTDDENNNIHTEYAGLLSKYGNLNISFVNYNSWEDGFKDAKKGDMSHGILNLSWSKEREENSFDYTKTYFFTPGFLIVKKENDSINTVEDLANKSVYVKENAITNQIIKEFKYNITPINLKTEDDLHKSLSKQDSKAEALMTYVNDSQLLKKYNLKVANKFFSKYGEVHLGISKNHKELHSIINKIYEIIPKSELTRIQNKVYKKNLKEDINLTKEEKEWIKNNIVKTGVEEWAPIIFSHGGKDYDGITADVLRLIVEKTGLKLEVTNDLWEPLLQKFKNKELDLLPATYYTEERAKYGLYSEGYYKMLDYIYVKEDNTSIKGLKDLKGKTLAIPKGFGTIPKIRKNFPDIAIVQTRDLSDSIQRVLRGEVDALYDGQIAVEYKMQEDLIVGLKGIPQKSFDAAPLHLFSHMDKPILKSILNKALKSIPPYEINKIKSKWLVEKRNERILENMDKQQEMQEDTLWLLIGAIGVFLFLLFILIIVTKFISNDFIAKSFSSSRFRIIALIIVSIVVFMLATLVKLTLAENKKNALASAKSDLEFVLRTTQDRLDTWIFERKNFLIQIGRDRELVEATKALLKVNKEKEDLKNSKELKAVREFFRKREKEFGGLGFFIIDKDFISVGSKRDGNLGSKNLIAKRSPKLLERVFNGEAVFIPPLESDISVVGKDKNEHTMFFAIPIQDKNNNIVAVLTQRLDVEDKFSEIIQSGRIGQSGESYLFSKDGFMLTKSRFRNDLIKIGLLKEGEKEYESLQLKDPGGNLLTDYKPKDTFDNLPLTKMAQNAISLDDSISSEYSEVYSDVSGYRDYRGVNVFGSWVWYKKYGFGLTTEVDESEALTDFYILRQNLLIITTLTLLLTIMAVVMLIILGEKSTRSVQKANNELNKLLESFDDNVIASKTDKKGFIKYASKAFCEISGYTQEELIGSPQSIVRHPDMPRELFRDLWATIKSGQTWRGEVKNRKKGGGFYWVDVVIEPEFDDENEIVGFSAIRQDITSKKEVEELSSNLERKVDERTKELDKNVKFMNTLIENLPSAVFAKDVNDEFRFITWNRHCEKLFGMKADEVIGKNDFDFFPKEQAEYFLETDKEVISKSEITEIPEEVVTTANGDRTLNTLKIGIPDENGNPNILLGIAIDITEQKKAQQTIVEQQQRFLTLFSSAPDSISIIKDGEYIDCNEKTLELFGVSSQEQFRKTKPSDYSPQFQENGESSEILANEKISKAIEEGANRFEWIHKRLDTNENFYAEVILSSITLNNEPHIYAVVRDISERKKAQQKIADQKQYIDSIMNSQSNIVISTDGEKLRTANKAFFDFFDVKDVPEFLSTLGDCICDTFDTSAPKEFVQKMMGEETWIEYVYNRPQMIHKAVIEKDGTKHIFSITSDRFEFAGEMLEVAVFTDITEIESIRKNIETILSNIMLPVLITSKKDRVILYANEYAAKQYESTIDELVGSSIDTVYTKLEQKDEITQVMNENGFVENLEEKYKTRTGKEFIGLLSVKPINYNNEESYIGMVVDITKQKEIEEEIRRIHKHTQSSIEYASLIQHSLIPSNDLFKKYFGDYFTIWHPKDIVGGDIYLFEELRNEDECLLMVIDCTGHGVPGAFVTMLVKAIERQVAAIIASDPSMDVSPAWILKYFNQTMKTLLKQEDDDAISNAGFDGAVLYYNKNESVIKFAGAEVPLFYIEDNEFKIIKGNRHSIGYKKSDANYEFKEHVIEAKKGMQFYLTSDGYLDQNGGEKSFPLGKKRFLSILEEYKDYSFADQQEVLLNELQDYQKDEERNDDITIVGIKIADEKSKLNQQNESWVI